MNTNELLKDERFLLHNQKNPYHHFAAEHNNHTHRQVINQLKCGMGTSLTVEKRCTGTKEEVLFNILKDRSFNFCCALRMHEEDSSIVLVPTISPLTEYVRVLS